MYVLITYDVNTSTPAGKKRLRQVAKCCMNHGQRVQNSVFECLLSEAQFIRFRSDIAAIIDHDNDSIRIYHMGKNYNSKIEHIGTQTAFEMEGELII